MLLEHYHHQLGLIFQSASRFAKLYKARKVLWGPPFCTCRWWACWSGQRISYQMYALSLSAHNQGNLLQLACLGVRNWRKCSLNFPAGTFEEKTFCLLLVLSFFFFNLAYRKTKNLVARYLWRENTANPDFIGTYM